MTLLLRLPTLDEYHLFHWLQYVLHLLNWALPLHFSFQFRFSDKQANRVARLKS